MTKKDTAPSVRPPMGPRPIFEPEGSEFPFTLYLGAHVSAEIRSRIEFALKREFSATSATAVEAEMWTIKIGDGPRTATWIHPDALWPEGVPADVELVGYVRLESNSL